jgi:hypothetical protein
MSILGILIGLLICLCGTILFGQFGLRIFISYKLTSRAIEVMLCNVIPLKRIPFADVKNVEIVSFKDFLPFVSVRSILTLRLGNRIFGKGVLVTQKSGLFRLSVLTPDNPEEFVRYVAENVRAHAT